MADLMYLCSSFLLSRNFTRQPVAFGFLIDNAIKRTETFYRRIFSLRKRIYFVRKRLLFYPFFF